MTRGGRIVCACVLALAALRPALGRSTGQDALDEGVARYRAGDYREAADAFRRAVELDPSLTKAWENLGWAHHRLGRDDEALRVWNTLLKIEPENLSTWNAVGEVALARASWRQAASAFERSLARKPAQPDIRLRLGQAYEQLGLPAKAGEQYRAALASRPGEVKAAQRLADLLETEGDLPGAEALLREAAARHPGSDGGFEKRLARVLARKGDDAYGASDWAAARAAYLEASRFDPDQPRYVANLGWTELQSGAHAAAIAAFKQAIDGGASDPAKLWRATGDAARDAGLLDEARAAYTEAARLDAGAAGALYPLAALAFERGDAGGAVAALDEMFARKDLEDQDYVRAADLFIRNDALDRGEAFFEGQARLPGHRAPAGVALGRLHAARGGAAYRAGDDAAAKASYEKALAADPLCRAALRDYGWVLWRLDDWDGVARVWSRYARDYPAAPEPRELQGRLHLHRGAARRAIEDAEAALALSPAHPESAQALLVKACLADGKYARARKLAAELAAAHPGDLAIQTLYGEALWRNLDFPAAKAQWKTVLDLGSDSPRAMHYWLRSMYETGDYDEAVAAARAIATGPTPSEPVMRLLAEDATVRGDDAGALLWYGRLTELWPQRVPYWIALCETQRRGHDLRAEERTLARAIEAHPDDPELALLLADTHRALHRPDEALAEYEALGERLGRNRTVFIGRVRSLADLGRDEEALALLRTASGGFLTDAERALEEASLLENLGRRDEAARRRAALVAPRAGSVPIPILLYHGLATHERTVSMPLDRFEGQMRALRDAGYETITVSELDAMRAGRRSFPRKPVLVTFDDARSDSFRLADPVLERYGMRATMFVPTVRIADESASNADWGLLRALRASGRWDFQGHGHLAHDPIPIDADGAIAEFLVNRAWLPDSGRLEDHEDYAARVDADYVTCRALLEENLPEQEVVGYAFPFSEMGQLHGGNDPGALAVNEASFRRHYRYGFVQDGSGYNFYGPAGAAPVVLRRLNVPRNWDGTRLMAHLAVEAPAAQARLDAAKWDLWSGRLERAEDGLRALIGDDPATGSEAGIYLARTLQAQDRPREALGTLRTVPSGPAWERRDRLHDTLTRELAWENDPIAGIETRVVSDSDDRDQREASFTGRYRFAQPVELWAEAGTTRFEDAVYPELSGPQLTLGAAWQALARGTFGGWVRGRRLSGGVDTWNGELTYDGLVDRHRFGVGCGVEDVPTAGALGEGLLARGCQGSYRANGRLWRWRARAVYRDMTDGNTLATAAGDATRALGAQRWIEVGGRVELGDSSQTSPLYYTPQELVTVLALARTVRSFPSGSSIDAEVGAGPSRDATAGTRVVARARAGWTQNWTRHMRTTLTAEYGQTPDYHRTSLAFSFGYRF